MRRYDSSPGLPFWRYASGPGAKSVADYAVRLDDGGWFAGFLAEESHLEEMFLLLGQRVMESLLEENDVNLVRRAANVAERTA